MPKKTAKKRAHSPNQNTRSTTTSTPTSEENEADNSVKLHADIHLQVGDHVEEFVAQFYLHNGADEDSITNLEKTLEEVVSRQVMGPMRGVVRKIRVAKKPMDPESRGFLEAELLDSAESESPMDGLQ